MRFLLVALVVGFAASAQTPYEIQARSVAAQQQAIASRMRPGIDLQSAAVRKQARLPLAAAPAFFIITAPPPPAEPEFDCPALSPVRSATIVEGAARRTGVSVSLLNAVIQQESAFHPCAVSNKGAQGLMQLMPETADDLGVSDPFDPEQNVYAGASLLKQLMDRYAGDLNRVVGAYNAGPARVDRAGGVPLIPETMNYVEKVLGSLYSSGSAINRFGGSADVTHEKEVHQ